MSNFLKIFQKAIWSSKKIRLYNLKSYIYNKFFLGSIVEHNAEYDTECSHFDHMISRYVLPWLLMLCLFGNVLNIMIYRLPYFDGSSSVHFLRVKALANLIFVQSRLFEIVHAWSKVPEPSFEAFYWNTRPFIITIANICGTISTW